MSDLNFPRRPSLGQLFSGPNGVMWLWDGVKWTAGAGQGEWEIPIGDFPDAPMDGWTYARRNGKWVKVISAGGGTILNGDLIMQNDSSIILDFPTPPLLKGPHVIAPDVSGQRYWVNGYAHQTAIGARLSDGGTGQITVDNQGNLIFNTATPGMADTTFSCWNGTFMLQPDNRVNIGNYEQTNDPLIIGTANGFEAGIRQRVATGSVVQADWTAAARPDGSYYWFRSGTPTTAAYLDTNMVLGLPANGVRYTAFSQHTFADSWDGSFIHFIVDGTDLGQFATLAFNDGRYLQLSGGTVSGPLTVAGLLTATGGLSMPSGSLNVAADIMAGGNIQGANIIASSSASPSLVAWDPSQNLALGFWNNTGQLFYGTLDGSGNPIQSLGAFNPSGDLQMNGRIRSAVSRLISQGSLNNPSVTVWDTGAGNAFAMWNGANRLNFGSADGGGLPGSVTAMNVDAAGNFQVAGSIISAGTVTAGGVVLTSDARLKRNPNPYHSGLDQVMGLKPVSYEWISKPGIREIGFLAQDVQEVMPEAATESGVSIMPLLAALVSGMKEINLRLEELERKK